MRRRSLRSRESSGPMSPMGPCEQRGIRASSDNHKAASRHGTRSGLGRVSRVAGQVLCSGQWFGPHGPHGTPRPPIRCARESGSRRRAEVSVPNQSARSQAAKQPSSQSASPSDAVCVQGTRGASATSKPKRPSEAVRPSKPSNPGMQQGPVGSVSPVKPSPVGPVSPSGGPSKPSVQ